VSPNGTDLLRRLAAQFAAAVADGSERWEVPGFRIHLWPTPDPFYRNVAIPTDARCENAEAIAGMLELFASHARRPRLEHFAELWPYLAAALEAAGLTPEREAKVMVLRRSDPRAAVLEGSADVLTATHAAGALRAFLAGAAEAFGEQTMLAASELEHFADGLANGTIGATQVRLGGKPVAGASLIRTGSVGELAGVWSVAAHRRQGHARACCRLLLDQFFADGGELAWLSAGDPRSANLYLDLGFQPCGTQLNYAGP
jgi:ribosomal protein S18 acetylase RimI-like enzyme